MSRRWTSQQFGNILSCDTRNPPHGELCDAIERSIAFCELGLRSKLIRKSDKYEVFEISRQWVFVRRPGLDAHRREYEQHRSERRSHGAGTLKMYFSDSRLF